MEIGLSSASSTRVKPMALACHHVQHKLLRGGGIQPSQLCRISTPAPLRACILPRSKGVTCGGGSNPWVMS